MRKEKKILRKKLMTITNLINRRGKGTTPRKHPSLVQVKQHQ
uniref:Uncharacterized protein n=1 Tax=Megaselia scalaris TaxID=36166 RepID=T1GWR1_MEGSC